MLAHIEPQRECRNLPSNLFSPGLVEPIVDAAVDTGQARLIRHCGQALAFAWEDASQYPRNRRGNGSVVRRVRRMIWQPNGQSDQRISLGRPNQPVRVL